MKKFLRYIPFLIILCTTILLFVRVNQDGNKAGNSLLGDSLMVGKNITDMELDTIYPDKGKINQDTCKGNFTIVNMFASWCVACVVEHKLFSGIKGGKLKVVGIAWRDNEEDTKGWLKKYGNPFDIVGSDIQGRYGISMGITGIPESFLVSPDGVILTHVRGPVTEGDILRMKEMAK